MLVETVLRVPALHCPGCIETVRRVLLRTGGVAQVEGDLGAKVLTIHHDPEEASLEALLALLQEVGFPGEVVSPGA